MNFVTREGRSRRLLRVHGLPFAQPASLPEVPHYAALVRAQALWRRETHRRLGELPPPVWNYPTTSRPGDNYRGLAEHAVTRTTRSRKLKRPLGVPEQIIQATSNVASLPAFAAPSIHRRHDDRRQLIVVDEIDRYPQTVAPTNAPFVATQRPKHGRRDHRQGLFLAAGDVALARVTAQYPAYVPRGFFRREDLHRTLQKASDQKFEPTPPQAPQPVTAWLAPCVNRRHGVTRLLAVAEIDEFPPTPPVPEQPLSAWAEPRAFKREGWRVRRDLPEQDVYSLTPGQAEATFPGWIPPKAHRRDGWRVLRTVEPVPEDVKLPAGHQPYGAWLAHEVTRRNGWRALRTVPFLAQYAEPVPAPVIASRIVGVDLSTRVVRVDLPGRTVQ